MKIVINLTIVINQEGGLLKAAAPLHLAAPDVQPKSYEQLQLEKHLTDVLAARAAKFYGRCETCSFEGWYDTPRAAKSAIAAHRGACIGKGRKNR